jgi:hypothetical protein
LSDKRAIPVSVKAIDSKINRGEMVEIVWRLKENIKNKSSRYFWYKRFLYHVKD